MSNSNVAKVELRIDARIEEVWKALTTPESFRKYMFGATVISDWKEGSAITWKGEWYGQPYEERGKILVIDPLHELKYEHISRTGDPQQPEQAHVVDILLKRMETGTLVQLTQENNASEEERVSSEKNWNDMLIKMKELLESGAVPVAQEAPSAGTRAA